METKFCITKTGGRTKIEVQGSRIELTALLASVMSQDPRIKKLFIDSTVAAIFESRFGMTQVEIKEEKARRDKEMIEAVYGSISTD